MSQSLLRSLKALEMLAAEPLGVTEIARRLEVDKAGVSRVLGSLAAEGWVDRNGLRYVLGERAIALGLGGGPTSSPGLPQPSAASGNASVSRPWRSGWQAA